MKSFGKEWDDLKEIIVYGFGLVGKKCINKLMEEFTVVCIIDNDIKKQKQTWRGIPVIGIEDAYDIIGKYKIIVLTGGRTYREISNTLQNAGLMENIHYCGIESFSGEWYWEKKRRNCLLEVHTALTMDCTLQCRNCNMFVPYYKEKLTYSFQEIKEDFDLFFQHIDYVFSIALLGGEPFLNKSLGEIIVYLGEQYGGKIGEISIISNGTVMPDEELLSILKKYNAVIYLSDYTVSVPYAERLQQIRDLLYKNGVSYYIRKNLQWCDFGFPAQPCQIAEQDARKHMLSCSPIFRGLNDKKFYYCHAAWSAEKCGLYKLAEEDYVDLTKLDANLDDDRRKLIKHSMGAMEKGYISFCTVCGGCGKDNPCLVKAGIQMRKE